MSDSLTEIMEEMRDAPPLTDEQIKEMRARDAFIKKAAKALEEAADAFVIAAMADNLCVRSFGSLDQVMHQAMRDAVHRLRYKGVIEDRPDFCFRLKKRP